MFKLHNCDYSNLTLLHEQHKVFHHNTTVWNLYVAEDFMEVYKKYIVNYICIVCIVVWGNFTVEYFLVKRFLSSRVVVEKFLPYL